MSNFTAIPARKSDIVLRTPDDESSVAELVRNFDWASTPLGPMSSWPLWLKVATVRNKNEFGHNK